MGGLGDGDGGGGEGGGGGGGGEGWTTSCATIGVAMVLTLTPSAPERPAGVCAPIEVAAAVAAALDGIIRLTSSELEAPVGRVAVASRALG